MAWVGHPAGLALVASLLATLKAFFRLGAVVLWPLVGIWVCEGPEARDVFCNNGGKDEQTRNASFIDEVQSI